MAIDLGWYSGMVFIKTRDKQRMDDNAQIVWQFQKVNKFEDKTSFTASEPSND